MEIGGIIDGGITIQTDRQIGFGSATTYSKRFSTSAPDMMYAATSTTNAQLSPGTAAFTLECWVYIPQYVSVSEYPIYTRGATTGSPAAGSFAWGLTGDTQTNYLVQSFQNGSTEGLGNYFNPNLCIRTNRWHHIAVCRGADNTLRSFIDGRLAQSTVNYTDNLSTTGSARIGRMRGTGTTVFNGYMSNLRFVNGTGLYTENFFVPTQPLTAITNTKLLTFQDINVEWIDNSGLSLAWAWPATARINSSAFSPFNPFGTI